MFADIRKFFSVTGLERRVFLCGIVMLPFMRLGLRLFGFKRWNSIMTALSPDTNTKQGGNDSLIKARNTARMVRSAAERGLYPANCLPQSMLLWWLLRWQRTHSELKLGMQKEMDILKGHAWVEMDGVVLNDTADVGDRYHALAWNTTK